VSPKLISLVIATYKRADMLRDTVLSLRALDRQEGVAVEVVLIDNDPSGGARDVTAELASASRDRFPVRYVHKARPGLSHARNRGIEEAAGEVVAVLDDDLLVGPGWLRAVLACPADQLVAARSGHSGPWRGLSVDAIVLDWMLPG
jgi:glycosyltransferase involved in cell wall biosynthesis